MILIITRILNDQIIHGETPSLCRNLASRALHRSWPNDDALECFDANKLQDSLKASSQL